MLTDENVGDPSLPVSITVLSLSNLCKTLMRDKYITSLNSLICGCIWHQKSNIFVGDALPLFYKHYLLTVDKSGFHSNK